MSPVPVAEAASNLVRAATGDVGKPRDPSGLVLEGWAQGFLVGSLVIMSSITLANMRKGVLLHKLILLELFLGMWHGFWILLNPPVYGWWLSVSAIFLNISWSLHNVIAWMKIKPFLPKTMSLIFIWSIILVQPYWVVEIYANFAYFHNINEIFLKTRPWEALARDPWWIIVTIALCYIIKTRYELTLLEIIKISPRFGVMLAAMVLSIAFVILDVLSVTGALKSNLPVGVNPFWKLAMVFKCLTDSVILDDFKTALDRLRAFKISRMGSFSVDISDRRSRNDGTLELAWDAVKNSNGNPPFPSPEGDYIHPVWKQDGPSQPKKAGQQQRRRSNSSPTLQAPKDGDLERADHFAPDSPMRPTHNHNLGDQTTASSHKNNLSRRDDRQSAEAEYAQAVKEVQSHDSALSPAGPHHPP